jgi:predicted DNA-binding transcriptional regulator YafY
VETEDGGLVFEAEVAGLTEITAWVLRWGAEARVLAPDALAAAVRREVQAMAGLYGSKGSG